MRKKQKEAIESNDVGQNKCTNTWRHLCRILNSDGTLLPILAFLLFFCFESLISDALYSFNRKWLSNCNESFGGCAIIVISAVITFRLIYNHNKTLISLKHLLWLLFVTSIYFHYRSDLSFYFWSFIFKGRSILYTDFFVFPIITLAIIQIIQLIRIINHWIKGYKKKKAGVLLSRLEDDSPINEVKEDVLGYVNIVRNLLSDINGLDLSESSYSVGIAGEWGLGKSSFFHILKNHIEYEIENNSIESEQYKDVIFVDFNPRASAKVKDIQKDFFDTYASALAQYHSGIYRYIRIYQDALQLPESNWIASILKFLQFSDINKAKCNINNIIRTIKKRVFVFIDDFDRLTAKEILEVMKVIDKNGDFIQTVYLTAYDKEYVNNVLQDYLGYDISNHFTDKYFAYELQLPNQQKDKLAKYVRGVLHKKVKANEKDSKSIYEILDEWDNISSSVIDYLPTLRHVKRFLNIFIGRYNIVRNDVDFSDFVRVTLLRYYDIGTYNALADGQLTRTGNIMSSTSDKILYKTSDFDVRLQSLSKWPGAHAILDKIIFEKVEGDYDLTGKYKHLCFKDAFPCYFIDFLPEGIYYNNLIELYNASTDEEAIDVLHSLIKYDKDTREYNLSHYAAVENFLRVRPVQELKTVNDIKRLFGLLCYLNNITRESINIFSALYFMFGKNAEKEFKGITKNNYKTIIDEAIRANIEKWPLSLIRVILHVNTDLLEDPNSDRVSLFTLSEIVAYAELCQKYYLTPQNTITTDNYDKVIMVSKIYTLSNGKRVIADGARDRLVKFITNHANDFVRSAIIVEKVRLEVPILKLYLRGLYNPSEFFIQSEIDTYKWLNENVTDKDSAYLFVRILKAQNSSLSIDLDSSNYEVDAKDIHKVSEIVKEATNSDQEIKVIGVINVAKSIEEIAQHTGISIEDVKETLSRLKAKGSLSPKNASSFGLNDDEIV